MLVKRQERMLLEHGHTAQKTHSNPAAERVVPFQGLRLRLATESEGQDSLKSHTVQPQEDTIQALPTDGNPVSALKRRFHIAAGATVDQLFPDSEELRPGGRTNFLRIKGRLRPVCRSRRHSGVAMGDFDLAAALGPEPVAPHPAPAHQEVKIGEHKADTPVPLPHHPTEPRGPGQSHKEQTSGKCTNPLSPFAGWDQCTLLFFLFEQQLLLQ
ncbi:uncharacterized protein LOC100555080 isoform X2 [Anolis carolinensis]|uniref:uncharacterized protein LOC100555080 isoform X2 n=1 Tax=Anolis carolinensis TaxID=28377 RepID=UPI002F2B7883